MIYAASLVTAFEAACLLQKHLGSYRAWTDFLRDCNRGRQNIAGHTLLPRGRLACLRGFGPGYDVRDIWNFIRTVKAAVPGISPGIKPIVVQIDSTRGWRISKFDRNGDPVARCQTRVLGL